jgi:caffeoyl-CoA O-methyltransferase
MGIESGKGQNMAKKTIEILVGMSLLIGAGLLVAQDRGRGPGPGGATGPWLDDLEKAYQEKNMDKVGELIAKMKEQRQQFQGRGGQRGPGGPGGGMRGPGGGRMGPQGEMGSSMSKPPMAKGEGEKKILAVLDEMDKNERGGMMNVPVVDGRLLRLLVETTGAKQIVEIGTSNGYSGIWQCLALKTTGGKLTTFEINAQRAALARQNFKRAGVDDIVTLVEGDAHEKVAQIAGPVDMCFIDADKEGYSDYLTKLLPKVRPGGLIVAHNITPGMADPKYVEAITTNPDLETIFYTQGGGVSVTLKKHGL